MTNGVQQIELLGFYVEFDYKIGKAYYVPLEYMFGTHEQITLEYLYTCNILHSSWNHKYIERHGCIPPVRDSVNILIVKVNTAMSTDVNNILIVKNKFE